MDNSLVLKKLVTRGREAKVLILVVMDNSLVPFINPRLREVLQGLNPCCNGQ